jgi:hypothetical protein
VNSAFYILFRSGQCEMIHADCEDDARKVAEVTHGPIESIRQLPYPFCFHPWLCSRQDRHGCQAQPSCSE